MSRRRQVEEETPVEETVTEEETQVGETFQEEPPVPETPADVVDAPSYPQVPPPAPKPATYRLRARDGSWHVVDERLKVVFRGSRIDAEAWIAAH